MKDVYVKSYLRKPRDPQEMKTNCRKAALARWNKQRGVKNAQQTEYDSRKFV